MDAVSRDPSVARGRRGRSACARTGRLTGSRRWCWSAGTDGDAIGARRVLLERAGGGWKVARSEGL
ncbi:hypothetical protein [Actinomadura luteofluorescens]|uniref:hypothetical protein n=1 Tax=Actinomadura luteofluorescens TaxID=46163 RepID=UPI003D8EA97F